MNMENFEKHFVTKNIFNYILDEKNRPDPQKGLCDWNPISYKRMKAALKNSSEEEVDIVLQELLEREFLEKNGDNIYIPSPSLGCFLAKIIYPIH